MNLREQFVALGKQHGMPDHNCVSWVLACGCEPWSHHCDQCDFRGLVYRAVQAIDELDRERKRLVEMEAALPARLEKARTLLASLTPEQKEGGR